MTGKPPPETENPFPEIAAELILTGAVPFDVTVTDFETAVPIATFPNAIELALTLKAGVPDDGGPSEMLKVLATPPALAVTVAVCAVLTPSTVVVNAAVVAPAFTVMLPGTITAPSLVESETTKLPDAGEVNEIVHGSVPFPLNALFAHVRPASEAVPEPVAGESAILNAFEAPPAVAVTVAV